MTNDQKAILALTAEVAALRSQLAEWELAAQQGHPSPCTLGPLCPYCEIENLHAGRALIVARAENAERALEENEARLAEAERDAARYRFIKQWARRLDITGYSLTNNEHFKPRIDEAMAIASQPQRTCTCPNGERPIPCPRKYSVSECQAAAGWTDSADEVQK